MLANLGYEGARSCGVVEAEAAHTLRTFSSGYLVLTNLTLSRMKMGGEFLTADLPGVVKSSLFILQVYNAMNHLSSLAADRTIIMSTLTFTAVLENFATALSQAILAAFVWIVNSSTWLLQPTERVTHPHVDRCYGVLNACISHMVIPLFIN